MLCAAVITVVPIFRGVRTRPEIVATAGWLEVRIHDPDDVDVGVTRFTLATLSKVMTKLVKVPTVGVSAKIVNFIEIVADFHWEVAACAAATVISPPSCKVTVLSIIDAIAGSDEVKLHAPVELDIGGVIVNFFCPNKTFEFEKPLSVGVPGLT